MTDTLLRSPIVRRTRPVRSALVVLGVLVALTVVRIAAPGGIRLPDAAQDLVTLALSVVIESMPFVVLGVVLSIVVQLWLPPSLIDRLLPARPLPRRLVLSVLGVLLPVCECGNVPLARGLIARGFTVPEATTFLLAAPIVNPITVLTTFQAFGWSDGILVSRVLGGFVIANLVGSLVARHPDPSSLLTGRFRAECAVHGAHDGHDHDHDHDHGRGHDRYGIGERWRESARMFAAETAAMLPALMVGAAIAGLIQVAVSRRILTELGGDPVWSVLALMLLAFVVAMCSNVDAFFVLSLGSTFLPGSIVAFLVFGPMIDVKMLALLRTTFTARTLVLVTVVVALAAATLGLAVNLVV